MTSEAFGRQPVLNRPLTLESLGALRALASAASRAGGVGDDGIERFAIAIDEAMTNAIRHGGGGYVTVHAVTGVYVSVEVRDQGPGIPDGTSAELPPPGAIGGRGLWLMHTMCDRVDIKTGPGGTTVVLTMHATADAG